MSCADSCGSVKWANRQVGIMTAAQSEHQDSTAVTPGASGINGIPAAVINQLTQAATERYHFNCDAGISGNKVYGVQSMGYDANFDLSPVFEFCDFEPYFINEGLPQVEVTVSKIIDGSAPVYLMATASSSFPTLAGRAACKAHIASAVFPCDQQRTGEGGGQANTTPVALVLFKDVQVNSISYTFGTDNTPFQEDITFVGNDVYWVNPAASLPSGNSNDVSDITDCVTNISGEYTDGFLSDAASIRFPACCADGSDSGMTRTRKPQFREDFVWDEPDSYGAEETQTDPNGAICDPDTTVLPKVIPGIACDGTNTNNEVCVQSITISADLNREELNCLGRRGPATRTITPPITVNTSVELTSEYDAGVSAVEDGVFTSSAGGTFCTAVGDNQVAGTIRVSICDGLRIYTGTENKLQSITVGGASTDGDNMTVTYNFQSFNILTVLHEFDPNPNNSGAGGWWANRADYLTDSCS